MQLLPREMNFEHGSTKAALTQLHHCTPVHCSTVVCSVVYCAMPVAKSWCYTGLSHEKLSNFPSTQALPKRTIAAATASVMLLLCHSPLSSLCEQILILFVFLEVCHPIHIARSYPKISLRHIKDEVDWEYRPRTIIIILVILLSSPWID